MPYLHANVWHLFITLHNNDKSNNISNNNDIIRIIVTVMIKILY